MGSDGASPAANAPVSMAMAVQDMNPPSSSQSAHRLPTVSASQALRSLRISGSRAIPTGLKQLDALLQSNTGGPSQGGFSRGQVTEIYGPPGSGKTALGLQATKNALQRGGHVVWIAAANAVPKPRLEALLSASPSPSPEGLSPSIDETLTVTDMLLRFHHYFVPTLAHLLALFVHPPTVFPPQGTALIVVDSVSTLFDSTYPRTRAVKDNKKDGNWAAGRRYAVMNNLVSTLSKIAAIRDIPVLVTNQVTTRYRDDSALLAPAMAGLEWDNGIATRLVMFRDWPPDPGRLADLDDEKRKQVRYIGIVKVGGVGVREADGLGAIIPFTVGTSGLSDVDLKTVEVPIQTLTSPTRPATRTYTEVADSEDELGSDEMYGWGEDDEVAAEGLLVDETALRDSPSEARTEQPPQKRRRTDGPEASPPPEED